MVNKPQRLDRNSIGAWVVKADPDGVWDYWASVEGLPAGDIVERGWTLGSTYRNELIQRGDLIAIWVTGKSIPGIYEIGSVTGEPYIGEIDETFLRDKSRAGDQVPLVPFRSVIMREPLTRSEIVSNPALGQCEQLRAPQMTNPTYLTPSEVAALRTLLGAQDLADAGWGSK